MENKEIKKCKFGHNCTSGCQNDFDCPCQADHCCAMTNGCEGCDDHHYNCDKCQDTGIVTKTEWTGTDDSHDVEKKCECQD